MGGVCSGGSGKRRVKEEKIRGFSGKLNKVCSSNKQKDNSNSYSNTNHSGKSPEKRGGSVEHPLSISGEFKQSKNVKNGSNKVC